MKATENTMQQIQRAIRKIAEKFPVNDEAALLTDIHIRVSQDTGELLAFDDDDNEITRCVVEQWIDNKDDDFYEAIAKDIRQCISQQKEMVENLSILKPYSFVLENDDCEHITELYVVDDDTVIIDPNLMEGLDEELDNFLAELLKN
ncbi:hypothetical protein [Xylanibacter brevis]|jgi:hypothetical protein|uniref:hypothetical protein n=1 Tax=Xylanibacter brevis TaxID=83231 RepID=UPI000483F69A|nr:hypothetical protein [Xylanibacter brevis]